MAARLLLSFYGDDFTGSADAMEALALAGVRSALFLEPPSSMLLRERFPDLQAVGVAGASRSMSPAQMDEALPPIFTRIAEFCAPIFHYKVCSTFDSSPRVGSIGRAIDLGQQVFHSQFVPLLVGAPALKRYCLFGNLFATVGEETFRLDRHPTMSRHPVTPMMESDLRRHLAAQTTRQIELFDLLQLTGTATELDERLAGVLETEPDIVLFDVLDEVRLGEAGRLIQSQCGKQPLFIVGSSGVEYALATAWQASGLIPQATTLQDPASATEKIIVVSGSCSPVTQTQIEWALERGFAGIRLDALKLANVTLAEAERARASKEALAVIATGRSVILFSALGPDDSQIEAMLRQAQADGQSESSARAQIGEQQGKLLLELLAATDVRRVVIAGGDTSSHAVRQLGIFALEWLGALAPGSPLCRATSDDPRVDGLELALKGGQGGKADYFGLALHGVQYSGC